MALAGLASLLPGASATTPGPSNSQTTLDDVLAKVNELNDINQINHILKTCGSKETRDAILSNDLQTGQDPLEVVHPGSTQYTLTCLYIL